MQSSSHFPLLTLQLVANTQRSIGAIMLHLSRDDLPQLPATLALQEIADCRSMLPVLLPCPDNPGLLAQLPKEFITLLIPAGDGRIPELRLAGFHVTSDPLAAHIETAQQFDQAKEDGAKWLAGRWFLVPQTGGTSSAQIASRGMMLRLLQLLAEDAETHELESVIKQDTQLSYQLLKLVNSVAVGLPNKISSFGQAIVILGRRQLQRWLHLLMFAQPQGRGQLSPLQATAIMRARLLELLSTALGHPKSRQEQAFMVGMFSLLQSLLGQPLEQIIRPLNLADEIIAALLEHEGELGSLLHLVELTEQGELERIPEILTTLQLSRQACVIAQFQASHWMQAITREMSGD